jgi:hypothetical protein
VEGESDGGGLLVGGQKFVRVEQPSWGCKREMANEYGVAAEFVEEHL